MNTKQKLVLAAAIALLIFAFVFPYASYPTKQMLDDGSQRSTVRWNFTPIWEVRKAHATAQLKGNPFDDVVIQWPAVLGLAASIVAIAGWQAYRLR